jgi:hypothetical protein
MRLNIVNVSAELTDQQIANATQAIAAQVSEHVAPEWGVSADLWVTGIDLHDNPAPIQTASDATIYIGDRIRDPQRGAAIVFGYHDSNYHHIPYGFVYLDICAQYAEPWSVALSHEIIEMLVDPTTVYNIDGPDPRPNYHGTVRYSLEICDPVQGDWYPIAGVPVCNFVTKRYYNMIGKAPTTNHLNVALAPFGVRPRGYVQFDDGTGAKQVNGSRVDAVQLEARALMAEHRRNARRAVRMPSRRGRARNGFPPRITMEPSS